MQTLAIKDSVTELKGNSAPETQAKTTPTTETAPASVADTPRSHPAFRFFTPFTIAIVGLFLTGIAALTVYRVESASAEARFNTQVERFRAAIEDRIGGYEQMLRGSSGLFQASEKVTREGWQAYSAGLAIEDNYPEVQEIGYAEVLAPDRVGPFIADVRAEGLPDFRVWPESDFELRSSILFLEPFDEVNRSALGFDMFSEQVRRAAMTQALESQRPAMSGRVKLLNEPDDDSHAGFLTFMPLFHSGLPASTPEERRQAVSGFVYSAFRIDLLMEELLQTNAHEEVYLEVHDGISKSGEALMYRSADTQEMIAAAPGALKQSLILVLSGHPWTFSVTAKPGFHGLGDHVSSVILMAAGLLLTGLAVIVTRTLRDTHSNALGLATHMTSELRESEQKVRGLVDSLEERVAERTESLVVINQELEAFSYSVSHDLRAPLRSINGFATAVREDNEEILDKESLNYLDKVTAAANRMSKLIDDMLSLSRVTRAPLDSTEVDISAVATHIIEAFEANHPDQPVRWTVAPGMTANGDQTMIESVLQNLIENAWKYSSQVDESVVEVGCDEQQSPPVFFVSDNGIGFDPKYAEKVFQPFKRLHDSSEYEGSGIGLSTVRRIIQRHRGKVWLETSLDGGTRACFILEPEPSSK